MKKLSILTIILSLFSLISSGYSQTLYSVLDFGAIGDGKTDNTGALQKAIDKAAEKGGTVSIPPGKYLVSGSLKVGVGVAVVGSQEAPVSIEPLIGTVIMATGGRDNENAPALFEMGQSSTVKGLTVWYPEQKPEDIRPYPWTFHLTGYDNTVENITLINSYNGIMAGPENNVRHRIRSVYGCVLRRGIFVDHITDIGRIENVQFHCHWWSAASIGGNWDLVFKYMYENLEAFIFGRTDWEYVTNNFVFPAKIGYRFIKTEKGACNGHFTGIGADACETAVQVDQIQYMGLLITGGEFVSFNGANPVELVVSEGCKGSIRLVNCAFWGPVLHNAILKGDAYVSFTDCYFSNRNKKVLDKPLIVAESGKLQINNCTFDGVQPSIHLKPGVKHAIIRGNNGQNGVKINNEIGERAIISENEPVSNTTEN